MRHCKKRALCLVADTLPIPTLRRCHYAQNLPTQKASEKERAWFQKENENCRRQKRSEEKTCKGQKETDLLILLSHSNETKNDRCPVCASVIFPLAENKLRPTALLLADNLDERKFAFVCLLRSHFEEVTCSRSEDRRHCLACPFSTTISPKKRASFPARKIFILAKAVIPLFVLFFTRGSAWARAREKMLCEATAKTHYSTEAGYRR